MTHRNPYAPRGDELTLGDVVVAVPHPGGCRFWSNTEPERGLPAVPPIGRYNIIEWMRDPVEGTLTVIARFGVESDDENEVNVFWVQAPAAAFRRVVPLTATGDPS